MQGEFLIVRHDASNGDDMIDNELYMAWLDTFEAGFMYGGDKRFTVYEMGVDTVYLYKHIGSYYAVHTMPRNDGNTEDGIIIEYTTLADAFLALQEDYNDYHNGKLWENMQNYFLYEQEEQR